MKVIAFVGMPGAGKSEASAVAREAGMPVVIMGDVLRDEVRERGLPPTDENIGAVANQLRKDEGMDAIAKRCIPKIEALNARVVVVDGIRGIAEVETFKRAFGDNFTLVKIDAPFELRLERLRHRARSDDDRHRRLAEAAGRARALLGHGQGHRTWPTCPSSTSTPSRS